MIDKIFSLQYYSLDSLARLVDADLSYRGILIEVGGLKIEIKTFMAFAFGRVRKFYNQISTREEFFSPKS